MSLTAFFSRVQQEPSRIRSQILLARRSGHPHGPPLAPRSSTIASRSGPAPSRYVLVELVALPKYGSPSSTSRNAPIQRISTATPSLLLAGTLPHSFPIVHDRSPSRAARNGPRRSATFLPARIQSECRFPSNGCSFRPRSLALLATLLPPFVMSQETRRFTTPQQPSL